MILILLLVYRAPVLVFIPLVSIGLSFLLSTDLLALLTQVKKIEGFEWWNFKVFTTTKIFIVVILFGAGNRLLPVSDLALSRGTPERPRRGRSPGRVGGLGRERAGGHAMTTICGLGMMFFADFGKFRNSGPAIAVCLLVTLCACITLRRAVAGLRRQSVLALGRRTAEAAAPEGQKELGCGPVNFDEVFAAADSVGAVEWFIIEQESFNHAPIESVRLCFEQMKAWGRA